MKKNKWAGLLLAVALSAPAIAGEVNVAWDASAGADGYRVYHGTAAGTYGPNPLELVATTTPLTTLLDGCVQQFLAVTAFNIAGESAFSQELVIYPRPVFLTPPYLDETGPEPVIALDGGNYAPGVTLTINNVAVAFVVVDCQNINVPVLSLPVPVQGQPMTFQACNGGVCQQSAIPVLEAVSGVAVN